MRLAARPFSFLQRTDTTKVGGSARGRDERRRLRVLTVSLAAAVLWAGAVTWYLVFHDEALARFISQQSAMQYTYEERIGALRLQLDRAAMERAAVRTTVEGRISDLADRQAALERRQSLLSNLAGESSGLPADPVEAAPPSPTGATARNPAKPFPTPDALELRMREDDGSEGRRSALESGPALASVEQRLDRLAALQSRALDRIAARAGSNARRMRGVVARLGLDPSRFGRQAGVGLGGPFVPLAADPFGIALSDAQRSLAEEEQWRRATAALPLRQPLSGAFTPSSTFGPRLDPFTRGLAMHTGIDMRAEYGEPARATAAGRVTAADYAGGYGNMVEIDHGNGLATRYAHLSSLAVVIGQTVAAGAIVGRVGSTGRSTGNHLHYETRIDGEPVDPQRFLRAAAAAESWSDAGR
ncbi:MULTISPECIES: peptidoglycan DD-metalloendopeptidase family protein [unclassified Methylobacterium]|uniref:peptidoglycan DD-metalloendopeptidase family protein n=1 Tax=unclassified Methylobacterium TaxID=2615210 RepID=UPI0009EB033D|nr:MULTISPECIES: peptidoglycan DD-metalloendopeptidase family protein [unclassified Methylobacterium]